MLPVHFMGRAMGATARGHLTHLASRRTWKARIGAAPALCTGGGGGSPRLQAGGLCRGVPATPGSRCLCQFLGSQAARGAGRRLHDRQVLRGHCGSARPFGSLAGSSGTMCLAVLGCQRRSGFPGLRRKGFQPQKN